MKTFNISSQNLYVVGCHGCSPTLHKDEESSFTQERYFIVPENVMIVYLTPSGVQSQGSKNIPFLKNLYDYNNTMFNYIFNPENYQINLDKINPNSYRHKDFFKSLPFFSDFNYLCNFELYPPGVPCPFVSLSFTMANSHEKPSYFEGITSLNNINFINYGQSLNYIDPTQVVNPSKFLEKAKGFIYTGNLIDMLNRRFNLNSGVFFISACRAEFFDETIIKDTLIDINPINRNCGNIDYDIKFIDNLIEKYPNSIYTLNSIKEKLILRNTKKLEIDNIIVTSYLQHTNYYNKNFINELYSLLSRNITHSDINFYINFKKITISQTDFNLKSLDSKKYQISLMEKIIFLIRENLIINPFDSNRSAIKENHNKDLYEKLRYVYLFIFSYINKNNNLPDLNTFTIFYNLVENNYNASLSREMMIAGINKEISQLNISIGGANTQLNYKDKYIKYKQKYLKLKN